MTTNRRRRLYTLLNNILESAHRIDYVLQGVSREDFCHSQSLDLQDIVAHRFSIIGEAATAIVNQYVELCDIYLVRQLKQAKGMRNIIIHEYFSVNWDTVWETAQQNIPVLIESIEHCKTHLGDIDNT